MPEEIDKKIDYLKNVICIDKIAIISNDVGVLFYLLPLIEKLVIEVASYNPNTSIENRTQGKIKTINPILDSLSNSDIIPLETKEKIRMLFDDKGLRNKVMHFSLNEELKVTEDEINSIKRIIIELIDILYDLKYKNENEHINTVPKL